MLENPVQDSLLLIVLLAVTAVAYFLMKYMRGKRATYFGNMKTLERTHGYKVFHISLWVLIIKLVLIALLYMVATNSIVIRDYQPVQGTDYVLLIDDSSSMANSDYPPNRLASAKEIATNWVELLPNSTGVSVVGFSRNIDYSTPLSYDKDPILDTIKNIGIDYTRSGTDIDYALSFAIDTLASSENNKTVLLLTDGTQGVTNATMDKARDEEVKVIAFGIGTPTTTVAVDVPEGFEDSYNQLALDIHDLELLTNATGGAVYAITSEEELQQGFEDATLEEVRVALDSGFIVTIIIAGLSIFELLLYARLGAL